MRIIAVGLAAAFSVFTQTVPRHSFQEQGFLTEPAGGAPQAIAEAYRAKVASRWGVSPQAAQSVRLVKEYKSAHNGVTHLVYRQQFQGIDLHNSEWTVNIDAEGRVINSGGRLLEEPEAGLVPAGLAQAPATLAAAMRAVRPDLPPGQMLLNHRAKDGKSYAFGRPSARAELDAAGRPVWLVVAGRLRPAWLYTIVGENGRDIFEVTVESVSGEVAGVKNLTSYQRAPQARVFTGTSPQPNPTPGFTTSPRPYPFVNRETVTLTGDPVASPRGWVTGNATQGNNAIAVHNPLGILFYDLAQPTQAVDGNFNFPLEVGPGQAGLTAYKDAVTTNLFYWVNRAHDLFYASGFDEAAGNFQADNLGRGGVGNDAMIANSHFGSAAFGFPGLNNAFFTAFNMEDGTASGLHFYITQDFGNGVVADTSLDSDVIIHEYTHGVSNRLVRLLGGFQGGSMGEGWSDFFALEFLTPEGAPLDGTYPSGEYYSQLFGVGDRSRPYSTNMEVNPLTYANLGRVYAIPEVHADGEIWAQVLWEVRAALIRQFGEREGRRRVRLLVLDGMKLSPPSPSMVDVRDAILLADRVSFRGASQDQLWTAFARRGLGALAQSFSTESTHIVASFEKPSAKGQMRFYEDKYVLGEHLRVLLADTNNTSDRATVQIVTSSGDLETLSLEREGSVFLGTLLASGTAVPATENRRLEMVPQDAITAFYYDNDNGNGSGMVEHSVPTVQNYTLLAGAPVIPTGAGAESRLFGVLSRGAVGPAQVTLPFAFPFYGKTYRTAYIYGDGLITFDVPNVFGCKDVATLDYITAIAPMWMELAYGGAAQPNENVFVSRGPGSITFRWAAETVRPLRFAPPAGPTPDPVNFAATLFEDGRIQMTYGAGNRNLTNDVVTAVSFGCQAGTPTVGISSGHETSSVASPVHSGRGSLENALNATWLPPFGNSSIPQVRIESPAAGEKVSGGVLNLRGVAWDDASLVSLRLDVLIDGTAKTRATVNTARPDFCAQQTVRGCPNVGFTTPLDLTGLGIKPGVHTVQVRASNPQGGILDSAPVSFEMEAVVPPVVTGGIDLPADGAEIRGTTQFRGWVHAGPVRITAVDALIDGISNGTASYGQSRPDICNGLSPLPVNCPGVGVTYTFDALLGIQTVAPGSHTLQFRARDASGRLTVFPEKPVTFVVAGNINQAPIGKLETPEPNATLSGTITVRGWAYDPDGVVRNAILVVNGISYGTVRYGLPRPDVCEQLMSVRACPNVGFETTLDTRLLRNGVNSFGIVVSDDSFATTTLPITAGTGMNVIVNNP